MLISLWAYIRDHWQGKLSLAKAFWINFVGIRVLLFLVQGNVLQTKDTDYSAWNTEIYVLIILCHGILFIWQIVGVLRSAETYLQETGSQATVWGAQLSLVIGLFLTISYAIQGWQAAQPVPNEENILVRMDREHASKYKLSLQKNGTTLNLDGTIELGITRNLKTLLAANPTVQTVILNSSGGNIYEARGLANIFRQNGYNTHVDGLCSSACTSAFVGGQVRTMARTARFGFHQYRIDADYAVLNADPQEEQKRDIKLFQSQGVSENFLQKIFSRPSHEMWYPGTDELLASGFVHKITDSKSLPDPRP